MADLATLPGVDIVAAGTWQLSTGPATFTTADLEAAIEAAACPAVGNPIIKIGHTDERFDGEPALGQVTNMALAAGGSKIRGDLAGMPGWLAEIAPSAYPQRSVEGQYNLKCSIGHTHPFVITALALLGVTPPGVGVLSGLDGIAALYEVDAMMGRLAAPQGRPGSGDPWQLTLAAGGTPMPDPKAAGVTTEDVRRAYYASDGVPLSYWITEMQMDPSQLIVCDEASDTLYRVPFTIGKGGSISFSDPVKVQVEYLDVAASRRSGMVLVFASRADSRHGIAAAAGLDGGAAVKNLGDNPPASKLKAMFALPGATKSDSKLPHHECSTSGVVGAANDTACSAAIGAINGGRGGVKGVGGAALKTAYNHLAAHLRADGKTPPDYSGPAASAADSLAFYRAVRAAAGDADEDVDDLLASLDAVLDQASALAEQTDSETLPADAAQVMDLVTAAEAIVDQLMDKLGVFDPDDTDADEVAARLAAAAQGTPSNTTSPSGNPGGNDGGGQAEPANQGAVEGHGPMTTDSHTHPHSAYGAQGGDATHSHAHGHDGDNNHNPAGDGHPHSASGAGPTGRGDADMDLSAEQMTALRASLGLKDDDPELTPERLIELVAAAAEAGKAAAKGMPPGVVVLDQAEYDQLAAQVQQGVKAHTRMLASDREEALAAAVRAGKFSASRMDHWRGVWDANPEGTAKVLAGLTPGVVPVGDIGSLGGPETDEDWDPAFARLFPQSYSREPAK